MSDKNNNIYIKDSNITRGEEALGYKKEADASKIADFYRPIWNEMVQAHAGDIDGYEKWTKSKLKARVEFFNKFFHQLLKVLL